MMLVQFHQIPRLGSRDHRNGSPIQTKTELAHLFIDAASNLARGKHCAPYLGALSHVLSRAPLYAGPETVLPPDLVVQAYEAFHRLRTGWRLRQDGPKHGPC